MRPILDCNNSKYVNVDLSAQPYNYLNSYNNINIISILRQNDDHIALHYKEMQWKQFKASYRFPVVFKDCFRVMFSFFMRCWLKTLRNALNCNIVKDFLMCYFSREFYEFLIKRY